MTNIPPHIMKALEDDLNTPLVIEYMNSLAKLVFKLDEMEKLVLEKGGNND